MPAKLYLPGQLWLYRTKPQDDESFSSWLVRLAWGMGIKLQSFTTGVLSEHPGFWGRDVDREIMQDVIRRLVDGTAVTEDRIYQTSLASYELTLWQQYSSKGQLNWILPIGRHAFRRLRPGQQFCRRCLAEDNQPYFRRRWRLSFNVLCEKHRVFLHERCQHCAAPVEFYRGDYGKLFPLECPITICANCSVDLREESPQKDIYACEELVVFQKKLNQLVEGTCSNEFPGATNYSHLFLDGLRYIVRALASDGRAARLRNQLLQDIGGLELNVSLLRNRAIFEELCLGDRVVILYLANRLLMRWPNRFISNCLRSRVSSSYLVRYDKTVPYWFGKEVFWYLNDRDYSPTETERNAVREYLQKQGLSTARNNINKWLGVSYSPLATEITKPKQTRWNARGPNRHH